MTTSQHALSTNFAPRRVVIAPPHPVRRPRRLISRQGLRRALGALWLLDGLLQLQPSMFTSNLITGIMTGIMQPATQGQPGLVADMIQPLINLTAHYLVPVNAMIALVHPALGVCLLGGWFVRPALLASIAWSCGVWYGGEGMGMILTGQASALTGAPGAVLRYALLGAAAYLRGERQKSRIIPIRVNGLLSRRQLQRCLAGFCGLAAVLQLQPYWWQAHQISQAITAMEGRGTLNGAIFGSSLQWLARVTNQGEIILNISLVVVALGLAAGLAHVRPERIRPLLVGSILLSLLLWWATEACDQLFTGAATDVNSGPLLILMALVCWPMVCPVPGSPKDRHPESREAFSPTALSAS